MAQKYQRPFFILLVIVLIILCAIALVIIDGSSVESVASKKDAKSTAKYIELDSLRRHINRIPYTTKLRQVSAALKGNNNGMDMAVGGGKRIIKIIETVDMEKDNGIQKKELGELIIRQINKLQNITALQANGTSEDAEDAPSIDSRSEAFLIGSIATGTGTGAGTGVVADSRSKEYDIQAELASDEANPFVENAYYYDE